MKIIQYHRRGTTPAHIGELIIGGKSPIVVQSMTNVDTNNIDACVAQCERLAEAGAQLVRLTAQGTREAKALGEIHRQLREQGCDIPLSADIHFNPKVAYEAAMHVEKVRINPGNFYDPVRKFEMKDYSDQEYAYEVAALQSNFRAFLKHLVAHDTALRIGVNHGSLSDRIMSRYGDTPQGMVESCMEYLEVCHQEGFQDVVISIKSSNPLVMSETVRLLSKRMEAEEMYYPLHLGVTEAGDGEDGRIKSAVGIGALLAEGLGDTIRVSLSEAPEAEIPEARLLVNCVEALAKAQPIVIDREVDPIRDDEKPLVLARYHDTFEALAEEDRPDLFVDQAHYIKVVKDIEALSNPQIELSSNEKLMIELTDAYAPTLMLQALDTVMTTPYFLQINTGNLPADQLATWLGFQLGGALMRGQLSGIYINSDLDLPIETTSIAFGLLQASRRRISRTDYISCPSCGRTLFDLQSTVTQIKESTNHLRGLKIGVMGCIVNGPGEMADADYGYVGSAPGKIDLYKQKERVKRGIPQEQAVDELINLIREYGDWKEPPIK